MARWPPSSSTSGTRSLATRSRSSSSTRPNASARTWAAWVRVRSEPSALDELRLPGAAGAVGQRVVALDDLGLDADQLAHPGDGARRAAEVGGRHLGLVAPDERAEVADVGVGLEPLAPVEAGVPEVLLVLRGDRSRGHPVRVPAAGGARRRVVDPGRRRRPALAQQRDVAVGLVELPGRADHDVAPPGGAVEHPDRPVEALDRRGRRDVGDAAVRALVERDVAQPRAAEAEHVVEEGGGGREDLPVAGPPGPLALRAVGGDRADVAAQRPDGRLVQPVDPLVAAAEPAGTPEVGVHDHAGHVVGREARVALDPGVAEAVGGEPRLEDVAVDPGRGDLVDLPERQRLGEDRHVHVEVRGGQVAAGVEVLAVAQREGGALGTEVGEPQPAVDVLARGRRSRRRRRAASPSGGRSPRPGVRAGRPGPARRRRPRGPRPAPSRSSADGSCTAGSTSRRSSRWPPIRSAASTCERAHCHEASVPTSGSPAASSTCSRRARSVPYWSAARGIPIWPRNHPSASSTATTFGPGTHQVRDVVGERLHPPAVLRVAGRQLDVADALAVEPHLVQPERRDVQPGRPAGRFRATSKVARSQYAGRVPRRARLRVVRARPRTPSSRTRRSSPLLTATGSLQPLSPRSVVTMTCADGRCGVTGRTRGPGPGSARRSATGPAVVAVVGADPVGVLHRGTLGQPPRQRRSVAAAEGVATHDVHAHLSWGHGDDPQLTRTSTRGRR